MYQVTIKFARPTLAVEFFSQLGDDAESVIFRNHWTTTYKETGKLLYLSQELSVDNLEQTTTFLWESEDIYNAAMADPIVSSRWDTRAAYNEANGITMVDKTFTTV